MRPVNSVLSGYGTTIFEVMSRLAAEHDAVNLGQGFPEGDSPQDVLQAASDALLSGWNQYPPMMGVPELREAVATHNKRFYDLDVDWQTQVMVTSGGTEAIAAALLGLIEPGDEVVLIEPLYDCYLPMVRRGGGVPKLVRVEPPDWELNERSLRDAFSDRTKLLLLNTPMNPAGKVFDRAELELIADLALEHDAYVVCDEVYEHLVFDGREHIPLMTLPGMDERCVRIGSAGKTFSLTGWKVGYVTAPAAMLSPIAKCHQFLVFTTPPNLQQCVAYGLSKDDAYFTRLAGELEAKRDRFGTGLQKLGFEVLPCHGTYFLSANAHAVGLDGTDAEICQRLVAEARVAAVPLGAFYEANGPDEFIRFSFCKPDAVLDEALERLRAYLA
ncbi:MAG: aminotransferase [Gaiellaceae bacterium]